MVRDCAKITFTNWGDQVVAQASRLLEKINRIRRARRLRYKEIGKVIYAQSLMPSEGERDKL